MHFRTFLEGSHSYSCALIRLPEKLSRDVLAYGRRLPDAAVTEREDEPHVTVLYGIHGDTPKPVLAALRDVEPFTIRLGRLSLFQGQDHDVLKIEVHSAPLVRLNGLLRSRLCHTQTHPNYVPHVTVAYLRKGRGERYVGDKHFAGESFEASSVIFSASGGATTVIRL